MEDERGDGGLGIHHESLRQLDADLAAVEQAEQRRLVRELRTRGIAEAVPLPAVPRLKAVGHRDLRRIRESPGGAKLRVQPLRRGLRGLDGKSLERVAEQILAVVLQLLRPVAYALSRRREEHRD